MSLYTRLPEILNGLVDGRVFPIVADQVYDDPYIIIQRVGGSPVNFLTGEAPEKQSYRIQVTVWAQSALDAETIGKQVEIAIRSATDLQPEVIAGAADTYDETVKRRGSRQDFRVFC